MRRRPCVVLGSSGLVGQRMQQRLLNHPWFEMVAVAGSSNRAETLLNTIEWRLEQDRPALPNLKVLDIEGENLITELHRMDVKVAFSCIPSDVAERVEARLSRAGIAVFSNASFHRRKEGIPLVISDINPEHLDLLSTKNPIACATNCTVIPLAVPLFALKQFGIRKVTMHSEQALSGAGWRLLYDEDANNGIVEAFIPGEAEKTAGELLHVLGSVGSPETFEVEVKCKRVARPDGHQVFVQVEFANAFTLQEVRAALESHRFDSVLSRCPSAPKKPLQIVECIDVEKHLWANGESFCEQPKPSEDLRTGMAVVVGNLEQVDERTLGFSGYSHNTIRGAAGGTLLLAEQAVSQGRIE